jgi:hypothetical protein
VNSTEERQAEQIAEMSSEALRRILDHWQREPSRPFPMVRVSGIGQVSIGMLRAELDRRAWSQRRRDQTPMRLPAIGNKQSGLICTEVDLMNEDRERAVILVWAETARDAVMDAEDYADARLGGEWEMTDLRPAS